MASNQSEVPYLERLAAHLNDLNDGHSTLVVLPNRRSLYVLTELVSNEKQIQCVTIDDLMQSVSGARLIEPEELLVSFYQAYSKQEHNPQPFDQFISWAVTFLGDVNDMDLHLGDIDEIYAHIKSYHETGESFTKDIAGPLELAYVRFWDRLPVYYRLLHQNLKEIKLAYRGMIYREVAEMAIANDPRLAEHFDYKRVFWVGVIPGNPSEHKLLEWLSHSTDLLLFADVDAFYLEAPMHEAGKLFKRTPVKEELHWKVDLLRTRKKSMRIHALPGKMSQVIQVKSILEHVSNEGWAKTVVVLADPSLLTPFMEVFKREKEKINITSGFPMHATQLHRFVMSWMHLHANAISRNGTPFFYHKHLEALFEYSVVQRWLTDAIQWPQIRQELIKRNMKFISIEWLRQKMKGDIFTEKAFELLFDWPNRVDFVFQQIEAVLTEWSENTKYLGVSAIEAEALTQYIAKLKLLFSQFNELLPDENLKALKRFVHRQIGYARLFIEQPKNDVLQVMGMLETRMIDFERVIIVGCADDQLPGNKVSATHVPYIHRVHFKLPTKQDTEALIAYHFYRLLQRAEQVDLIYSTTSDALSSGEPSRYIHQILEELVPCNSDWKLENPEISISAGTKDQDALKIYKDADVVRDIRTFLSRRVSPSALIKFINSPLEFYYYYVLGVKEEDDVEEDIEATTLGSVVHNVLEEIYKPFIAKSLQVKDLELELSRIDDMVEDRFLELFSKEDLRSGRNLLFLQMAQYYVRRFIRFEMEDIKQNGAIEIVNLEERVSIKHDIAGTTVNLFGFIDRVDRRHGITRIIDYKTGKVKASDLKFSKEKLATDAKSSKAFQVAFYKFVYCIQKGVPENQVESAILSFRNLNAGYMSLDQPEIASEFEGILDQVVGEMLDETVPFEHRSTSQYITF